MWILFTYENLRTLWFKSSQVFWKRPPGPTFQRLRHCPALYLKDMIILLCENAQVGLSITKIFGGSISVFKSLCAFHSTRKYHCCAVCKMPRRLGNGELWVISKPYFAQFEFRLRFGLMFYIAGAIQFVDMYYECISVSCFYPNPNCNYPAKPRKHSLFTTRNL